MNALFRPDENFSRIVELTPKLRRHIEATVEHLLSVLDQFDGDENLEEDDTAEEVGDEEPLLGAPERHPGSWEYTPLGIVCREPGAIRHVREKSQEHWADGPTGARWDDREEENEHGGNILDEPHDDYENDLEDDVDSEPLPA